MAHALHLARKPQSDMIRRPYIDPFFEARRLHIQPQLLWSAVLRKRLILHRVPIFILLVHLIYNRNKLRMPFFQHRLHHLLQTNLRCFSILFIVFCHLRATAKLSNSFQFCKNWKELDVFHPPLCQAPSPPCSVTECPSATTRAPAIRQRLERTVETELRIRSFP